MTSVRTVLGVRRAWRPLAALGAIGVAAILAGCVAISQESAAQQDVIGSVKLTETICASGQMTTGGTTCPGGNSSNPPMTGQGQVLLGYRIPDGARGPAAFASTDHPTVTFTASPTYASELERLNPTGSDQHWVGYISDSFAYATGAGESQELTITPVFALRSGDDGSPFVGPFAYRAVVGYRSQDDNPGVPGVAPDAPVQCEAYACIDYPDADTVKTNETVPTRDLGIIPGSTVTAGQGKRATVRFDARYAGKASPDASFALSATTSLSGAHAAPAHTTLAPAGDSKNPEDVTVDIPDHAAPGHYTVTLTAQLANGQTRTGTARLTVVAKPTVRTQPATQVSTTRELFNAYVDPNGSDGKLLFQYGTTTAYGGQSPATDVAATSQPRVVSTPVAGLRPDTLYHVRAVAFNAQGATYGVDQTFATVPGPAPPPSPPSLSGLASQALGATAYPLTDVSIGSCVPFVGRAGTHAHLRIRHAVLRVAVVCEHAAGARISSRVSYSRHHRRHTRRIPVQRVALAGYQAQVLPVRLSRHVRKLLRQGRRRRLSVTFVSRDAGGPAQGTHTWKLTGGR